MVQLFTPLVNSSVGQATPVATTTPNTNGPVVETVEVIEIDPPEKSEKKVDYLSLLQHYPGWVRSISPVAPTLLWQTSGGVGWSETFNQLAVQWITDATLRFTSWKGTHITGGLQWTSAPMGVWKVLRTLKLSSTANTSLLRLGIVWKLSF